MPAFKDRTVAPRDQRKGGGGRGGHGRSGGGRGGRVQGGECHVKMCVRSD